MASSPVDSRFELLLFETIEEERDRRNREQLERLRKLQEIDDTGICEFCPQTKNIEWIPAMTRYHWDIDKEPLEDPNRSIFLCPRCSSEYNANWQDRWDDYYSGLL